MFEQADRLILACRWVGFKLISACGRYEPEILAPDDGIVAYIV